MLPIVDKPLIQYAVEEAQAAGIEEFILVTGRGKTTIADHFDRAYELAEVLKARGKTAELEAIESWMPAPGQVNFTRQREALGLGHAVWCARNMIGDEPFAVILPDDLVLAETPCLKQLIDAYGETGGNLAAVMEVPRDQTYRYGILDIEKDEGLVDRHLAGSDSGDLFDVLVHADNLVPKFREARTRNETDITGSDHRDMHDESSPLVGKIVL